VKILLDNCVPRPVRRLFAPHEVHTAFERGWAALGNGALLREAAAAAFDLFVTVDQNLQYQQNLAALPLPILVLVSPSLDVDVLARCAPYLASTLSEVAAAKQSNRHLLVRISPDGVLL
jgi:hypothetical protein